MNEDELKEDFRQSMLQEQHEDRMIALQEAKLHSDFIYCLETHCDSALDELISLRQKLRSYGHDFANVELCEHLLEMM